MADTDFDVSALVTESMRHASVVTNLQNQIRDLIPTSDSVDQLVAAVAGGTDRNGDTPLSLQTKELGALEAQQRKQAFYNQIGNGQGYAKVATDLSTQFYNAMESAKETAQSVAERKSVGLLDNPLAWAINRVILPDEEAALSGQLTVAKVSSDQLQTLTKMADDDARVENEFATKLTAAAVDSKVQGLVNNLKAQALQTRMTANAQNVHTLAAVMQADGEQLRNIKFVIEARNSAEHLELSKKEFQIRSEQFEAWKKENAEKQDFAEQMTQMYNIGADITGKPMLTSNKVQTMFKMGGTAAQEAQALVELGMQNLNQGNVKLGVTPATAVTALQGIKQQAPEAIQPLYSYGFATVKARENNPTNPLDTKNPAARDAAFNEAVKTKALEYQANVDYKDKNNPYILPSPKILGQNPEIASTVFYQKVIAPLVATDALTTSDPQKLVPLGLEAVKNGTIKPKDWIDGITTYYGTGAVINNVGREFHKYAVPEQTTYNTTLKTFESPKGMNVLNPFSTYENKIVNMANPVDFANWAVRQLRAETMTKSVEGY